MNERFSLANLRSELGRTWLIVLFGAAYIISQITIILILEPITESMIILQTTGVSASAYLAVFRDWEASGGMDFYRGHFILDDVHWVFYTGLFTAALCRLFELHNVAHRYDWLVLLPLASGLLDWYENRLQHLFLSASDFATIVDPLPLYSTVASDVKWLLSAVYVSLAVFLLFRLYLKGHRNAGD